MSGSRRPGLLVAALLLAAGVALIAVWWSGGAPAGTPPPAETVEEQIAKFCSACHKQPKPDILPRFLWTSEIEKMYEMAGTEEVVELPGIPPIESTILYYRNGAPETLPPPTTYAGQGPGPLRFLETGVRAPGLHPTPAVASLKRVPFLDETRPDVIVCDMRSGEVAAWQPYLPERPRRVLARLSNPCHAEVVDLDGDGVRDLIVAELGSFLPEDHDRGKVIWLRGLGDGRVEVFPLLERVGRVADVEAADVDGDGDLDLAVAVFGWRKTGKVLFLENSGERDGRGVPLFDEHELDPRQGAIHVPIVDLDEDGRLDIVALISQHHETVAAYLNDGKGWFERKTIYEAPHPDWGCAGIEVVDLDGDGDLDVVLTCGDTLDTLVLHAHQGVYWLENRGTFPFRVTRLATLVGAHKVRTADLDGDGDLDLAASSFLPQLREEGAPDVGPLDSVLWIEQTSPGAFRPYLLVAGRCDHPSLEVGDFDGDGRMDFIVGHFVIKGPLPGGADWLTIFTNHGSR